MYLRLANVLYFELHHISLCVYNKAVCQNSVAAFVVYMQKV